MVEGVLEVEASDGCVNSDGLVLIYSPTSLVNSLAINIPLLELKSQSLQFIGSDYFYFYEFGLWDSERY